MTLDSLVRYILILLHVYGIHVPKLCSIFMFKVNCHGRSCPLANAVVGLPCINLPVEAGLVCMCREDGGGSPLPSGETLHV